MNSREDVTCLIVSEVLGWFILSSRGQPMEFSLSKVAQDLSQKIRAFLEQEVFPHESVYYEQLGVDRPHWRDWKVPSIMETWKSKARAAGLWNLFLPPHDGVGLSNCDYAPLAEIMG